MERGRGVVTIVMASAAFVSPLWPAFVALAIVGFYFTLAPLLHIWPWHQGDEPLPPTGITAGHDITAGGDIDAHGTITAGHGVHAGGRIRSATPSDSSLLATMARRRADLTLLGKVNPLAGKYSIRQFAVPLEHDEKGCVIRVVVAADCRAADGELKSTTKDTLEDAPSRSSLETWVSEHTVDRQADTDVGWVRASPNTGQIATFKSDWGALGENGSLVRGKTTLQLPPGFRFGNRVVLVIDIIEQAVDEETESSRLRLTFPGLHGLLHNLGKTLVDEVGRAVFPLVCEDIAPPIVGPSYEIDFGDRSLDTLVQIPSGFTRPPSAHNYPWASIDTPEQDDSRDLASRDSVLRRGIEKVLRKTNTTELRRRSRNCRGRAPHGQASGSTLPSRGDLVG